MSCIKFLRKENFVFLLNANITLFQEKLRFSDLKWTGNWILKDEKLRRIMTLGIFAEKIDSQTRSLSLKYVLAWTSRVDEWIQYVNPCPLLRSYSDNVTGKKYLKIYRDTLNECHFVENSSIRYLASFVK